MGWRVSRGLLSDYFHYLISASPHNVIILSMPYQNEVLSLIKTSYQSQTEMRFALDNFSCSDDDVISLTPCENKVAILRERPSGTSYIHVLSEESIILQIEWGCMGLFYEHDRAYNFRITYSFSFRNEVYFIRLFSIFSVAKKVLHVAFCRPFILEVGVDSGSSQQSYIYISYMIWYVSCAVIIYTKRIIHVVDGNVYIIYTMI